MLKNYLKNRKAQNTGDYVLLFALVAAGIIVMGAYTKHAMHPHAQGTEQNMVNADGNATQDEGNVLH